MPTFKDAAGREWKFCRITLADLDELAALGLDVEAVSEDLSRLAELTLRRKAFAAVLWWFVQDSCGDAGVEPRDLHAALDGDALARAVVAIRDAVIDFFPWPPETKEAFKKTLDAPADGSEPALSNSPPSPAGSTPGG